MTFILTFLEKHKKHGGGVVTLLESMLTWVRYLSPIDTITHLLQSHAAEKLLHLRDQLITPSADHASQIARVGPGELALSCHGSHLTCLNKLLLHDLYAVFRFKAVQPKDPPPGLLINNPKYFRF
jgi:hypothetical protein